MMTTKDDVARVLQSIAGPDGRTPLPQSGALSDVVVHGGKVYFSIAIDPARADAMAAMRANAEKAVKALPGVETVVVTLTAERAPAPKPAAAGAAAPGGPGQSARAAVQGIRHIIAVASGKGGVGKSTTAANLSLALSRLGWKVGVLDADIYGPSMPKLFAIHGKPQMGGGTGKMLEPMQGYGLKVMSMGFLVEEETPMIWRGPMVMGAIQQMLREVNWGALDVLVVDMPPGTGDAQLTMAQAVPLAGAVIVSTPQDLALIDARRGVAMFRKTDVPILGIVENMATFICPHCGKQSDIFGHGGARKEAERIGVPFLGEIPLHMDIREKSDSGQPPVVSAPDGPHAQAYLAIARQVMDTLEGTRRRTGPKIVIE
ncbi:MAG: P-loop NTPase [Beijerinckiaceae bacterium]